MFIEFLVVAEYAVGQSEFQNLDELFCRDLADICELVHVEILELITCSATGTGMLVKTALTSNETKVSSSGFIERCLIFLIKSVLSLTMDEVLPQ